MAVRSRLANLRNDCRHDGRALADLGQFGRSVPRAAGAVSVIAAFGRRRAASGPRRAAASCAAAGINPQGAAAARLRNLPWGGVAAQLAQAPGTPAGAGKPRPDQRPGMTTRTVYA